MTVLIIISSQMNGYSPHRVAGAHEKVKIKITQMFFSQGKTREQILIEWTTKESPFAKNIFYLSFLSLRHQQVSQETFK